MLTNELSIATVATFKAHNLAPVATLRAQHVVLLVLIEKGQYSTRANIFLN